MLKSASRAGHHGRGAGSCRLGDIPSMKTGYVYIVALDGRVLGRLGRILRLCVSLRHPEDRVAALRAGAWRTRRPRLIGYAFVEDLVGARSYVRAALKSFRLGPRGRSF